MILGSMAALPVSAADTPFVVDTTPADGGVDVAVGASLSVTFNEPVAVTGNWFRIDCNASSNHLAAASGGPVTWTVDPINDFIAGEGCALSIVAADITNQDGFHPMSNATIGFTIAGEPPAGDPTPPPTTTFGGFKWPIKALPGVNRVHAGWIIPIRFSLGGDPGQHSFTAASQAYTCGTTPPSTADLAAVTRGHRAVRYNGRHGTYTFVWKTNRSWRHTCRVFVLTLDDGQTQAIAFRFS